MSEALEKAVLAEKKATCRYLMFRNMFFVYLVVVTLFTSFQTIAIQNSIKDNLAVSRQTAATNHQRTQDYVKCIAQVLLKPLVQRKDTDFDECTVKETADSSLKDNATVNGGSQQKQQNSVAGEQQPATQAPQIIVRDSQDTNQPSQPDPVATAPPDPEEVTTPEERAEYESTTLRIIDGILREVDNQAGGTLNGLGL